MNACLVWWCLLAFAAAAGQQYRAVRIPENPIIHPGLSASIGANINGPSLVRAPDWLPGRLGRYYLYFADHNGTFIRLAYAERLAGPWKIHEPGTLRLAQTACRGHIASPDIHLDENNRQVIMYFHGPVAGEPEQKTFRAVSRDGLHFTAEREILGPSYFRVWQWDGYYYALSTSGFLWRSRDGAGRFESGPALFPISETSSLRHAAVMLDGDRLTIFFSRRGDRPERILVTSVRLTGDWKSWRIAEPVTLLEPEKDYEGADLPLETSRTGAAKGRLRELRDPAIYREGDRTWLLYSVAGESGIALAELR
jgi:hypothetical protein